MSVLICVPLCLCGLPVSFCSFFLFSPTTFSLQHAAGKTRAFDPAVVAQIYNDELNAGNSVESGRLMLLEFTGFLENYLWPNFSPDSSFEHVMCIMLVSPPPGFLLPRGRVSHLPCPPVPDGDREGPRECAAVEGL